MIVQVWHRHTNPITGQESHFTYVANVIVDARFSERHLCESVFERTNHVRTHWFDNEGVGVVGEREHRSTSVGDVIVFPNGRAWRCNPVGWGLIEKKEPDPA